jgi:hypothetical protein
LSRMDVGSPGRARRRHRGRSIGQRDRPFGPTLKRRQGWN